VKKDYLANNYKQRKKKNQDMRTKVFQRNSQWMWMIWMQLILCSLFVSPSAAQNVIVTVMPVQQILPPQAMLYMSNHHPDQ